MFLSLWQGISESLCVKVWDRIYVRSSYLGQRIMWLFLMMVKKTGIGGVFLESVHHEISSGSIRRPSRKEACCQSQKSQYVPGFELLMIANEDCSRHDGKDVVLWLCSRYYKRYLERYTWRSHHSDIFRSKKYWTTVWLKYGREGMTYQLSL